jgi:hypothetical protein
MLHSFLKKLLKKTAEQVESRIKEGMIEKVKLDLTFLTKYSVDFPGHQTGKLFRRNP